MPGKNKSTASSEPLEIAIPKIFDQVQNSTANHGKNYVALRKLHVEAAAQVKEVQKGRGLQLVGEKAFQDVFLNCMLPVLSVKKGVFVADRVVRFIGSYVKFICTKGRSR
jgi:condensin complex subunit 3